MGFVFRDTSGVCFVAPCIRAELKSEPGHFFGAYTNELFGCFAPFRSDLNEGAKKQKTSLTFAFSPPFFFSHLNLDVQLPHFPEIYWGWPPKLKVLIKVGVKTGRKAQWFTRFRTCFLAP